MILNESKEKLFGRIGWCENTNTSGLVTIDTTNQKADSGRFVNSFHQLCTVENIYSTVPLENMETVEFNKLLDSIRKQSVESILSKIFDQHILHNQIMDYSGFIDQTPRIFDDAIGFCMAVNILESFVSSPRSNLLERNAKFSFQNLKIELEGVRNDGGFYVASGIKYELKTAIAKAQKIIFPDPYIIDGEKIW